MKSILVLLSLTSPLLYAAQVYKCVDQIGNTLYQDTPCIKGSEKILDNLPSNSIKGPPIPTRASEPTRPVHTSEPQSPPSPAPKKKVNTDLPATENCSVDNPDRDPEFCRPGNLNNVYNNPMTSSRPGILPRPQPVRPRPKK